MLLAIRDKAQGWFAWAIIIFISIPFALWGIQSYLDIGSAPVAVEVNGTEITAQDLERRTRNYRNDLRERLGASYKADLLEESLLRQQMLEQMISEVVQQQVAIEWGLHAGDELVRESISSNPAFQGPKGFDLNTYDITLRNNGYSQTSFESSVRQEMIQRQFVQGIQSSAFLTKSDLATAIRLQDQQRELEYATVAAADYLSEVSNSDEEIQAYFRNNAASYRIAERVKLEYLMLDLATVAAQIDVTDDQLRDYFSAHESEFQVPEDRRVRHILINLSEDAEAADASTAETLAQNLYARINSGEDFATLAAASSQDPGSANQGGDLGWMSPGTMPEEFENTAFSLSLNEVSEPVKTPFGYHLIEVTEVRDGGKGTFDTLRADIERAYKTSEAESRFFELAEKLAEVSYENPDSLLPAADALGITVQASDWISRSGSRGDLGSARVIAAAFSDDVLGQGNNSELIELENEKVLVVRSVEHEAEQTRPFDDVRDQVIESLSIEKAAELAASEGEKLLNMMTEGQSLASVAAEQGLNVTATGLIDRSDISAPSTVVNQAFSLPRPTAGTPSQVGIKLPNGDYALLIVTQVKDGTRDALDADVEKLAIQRQDAQRGQQEYLQLSAVLRNQAEVIFAEKVAN